MWNIFGNKKEDEAAQAGAMAPNVPQTGAVPMQGGMAPSAGNVGGIQVNNVGGAAPAAGAPGAPAGENPEIAAAMASIQEDSAGGAAPQPAAPVAAQGGQVPGTIPGLNEHPMAGGGNSMTAASAPTKSPDEITATMHPEAAHLADSRTEFDAAQPAATTPPMNTMQDALTKASEGGTEDTLSQKSTALETGMPEADGAASEIGNTLNAISDLQGTSDATGGASEASAPVTPEPTPAAPVEESAPEKRDEEPAKFVRSEDNINATIEALKNSVSKPKSATEPKSEPTTPQDTSEEVPAKEEPAEVMPKATAPTTSDGGLPDGFAEEVRAVLAERSGEANADATAAALGKVLNGYTELGEFVDKETEKVLIELVDYYRHKQGLHNAIKRAGGN